MSKLSRLITNNNKLKTKITSSLKQGGSISVKDDYLLVPSGNVSINSETLNTPINSETQQKTTLIDDSIVKGGYHVLSTIEQRDAILCCYRKQGMKVVVVGEDFSFKEYVLKSDSCDENIWEEIIVNVDIDESEVSLIEDYSELGIDIQSQMELNTVLKNFLLQLQQDIQDIEVPTKTSELLNDGEDGVNPFITAQDIPTPVEQVNSDWNATSGKAEILNKPTIPAPVDISGKLDKPLTPDNVPTKVILGDGTTKPLSELGGSGLLASYTESNNGVLQISTINYTTGDVVCAAAHGLTIGAYYKFIPVPKSFNSGNITNLERDWKAIPYEYNNVEMKLLVVDSTTVRLLQNNTGAVVTVNAASTENGAMNKDYWQIEVRTNNSLAPSFLNLPIDTTNIKILTTGIVGQIGGNSIMFSFYDSDGNQSIISGIQIGNLNIRSEFNAIFQDKRPILFHQKIEYSTDAIVNNIYYDAVETVRNAGAGSFASSLKNTGSAFYFVKHISTPPNNRGVKDIGFTWLYANGTKIKIFKM